MKLISINIGHLQTLHRKDRMEKTASFKLPVDHPVNVTRSAWKRMSSSAKNITADRTRPSTFMASRTINGGPGRWGEILGQAPSAKT